MNKFKVALIAATLLFNSIAAINPSISYATELGCPDTWNLPSQLPHEYPSSDYKKYFEANYETIIKGSTSKYSFDNVNWKISSRYLGPVLTNTGTELGYYINKTNLFRNIRSLVLKNDEKEYGEDKINSLNLDLVRKVNQISIKYELKVEKKNCSTRTFEFNGTYETPKIIDASFQDDFKLIENKFVNYQLANDSIKQFNECVSRWKNIGKSKVSQIGEVWFCRIGGIRINSGGGMVQELYISLIPYTTGCFKFNPGNVNRADGFILSPNSNCKFAVVNLDDWSSFESNSNYDGVKNIRVYESFNISTANSTITIACRKGKTTKSVSGTNPKCPAGYKKITI